MAEVAAPSVEEILQLRVQGYDYWQTAYSRWDTLIDVYHGNYHKLWPEEFRVGEIPKTANWIKLGWDRYARMVGKVPNSQVNPSRISRVSQTKAEKIEKILGGYDECSGSKTVYRRYAWNLVGLGASVMGIMPDPMSKGPKFFWRDPRSVIMAPGAGSTSTTPNYMGTLSRPDMSMVSAAWAIITENVTATYLYNSYPDLSGKLDGMMQKRDLMSPQEMITYMDKNWWIIIVNGKKLLEVEIGLDFVPLRMTTMYVPGQLGGQSMFEQNIGLVLAYMRLLNQKLAYNDNIVWPWLVMKGLSAEENPETRTIRIYDDRGDAAFLNPPGEIQAERDLEMLDRLIRIMNEDTEALRGEAPGSNVTARGLQELGRSMTSNVMDYWDSMQPDIEFLRSGALMMDEELYGGQKKYISGRIRGEGFEMEYVPKKDIAGHYSVKVDFGIGVGGFDGFVELMQLAAQGYVDEQTVMENSPFVKSVSETRKRVFLDRIEKMIFEMTAGMAPAPILKHLTEWHAAVNKGQDPWDWITKNPMPDPMAAQQEAAGGMPGQPPLPGGDPMAAMMGGPGAGAAPAVPAPPSPQQILALAQGRR